MSQGWRGGVAGGSLTGTRRRAPEDAEHPVDPCPNGRSHGHDPSTTRDAARGKREGEALCCCSPPSSRLSSKPPAYPVKSQLAGAAWGHRGRTACGSTVPPTPWRPKEQGNAELRRSGTRAVTTQRTTSMSIFTSVSFSLDKYLIDQMMSLSSLPNQQQKTMKILWTPFSHTGSQELWNVTNV